MWRDQSDEADDSAHRHPERHLKQFTGVQAAPILFGTPKTTESSQRCRRSRSKSGRVSRAFIGGYPKGLDFGARLCGRSPEGRQGFCRSFDSAIDLPGAEALSVGEAAREATLHLAEGVIERAAARLARP